MAGKGRGKGAIIDGVWYRSSYEVAVVQYCHLAKIEFEYESIRVQWDNHTKISDFLIDGEIYEVYGWQDKSDVVAAFDHAGYRISLIGPEEVDLIRMFISG